jgi:DNA-binding NtrC family response regulator
MYSPLCLIVDDEPAIRTYLSVLLKSIEIRSLEAENAIDALRILKKLGDEIDLLITDIEMPGDMDGVDLAYSAKNMFSRTPVILISGTTERSSEGFTFVRKPFKADAIRNAVDKVMIKTRAGGAL